jgi:hypothetical protein
MKKITMLILGLSLALMAYGHTPGDTIISNNPAKLKVKLLYFHITDRCHTCYEIEKHVLKTIADHFQTELDSGIVDLNIVNCELPENKELVDKYMAYGSTLAITPYQGKTELKTDDITGWAFQRAGAPELFVSELKAKLDKHLKL